MPITQHVVRSARRLHTAFLRAAARERALPDGLIEVQTPLGGRLVGVVCRPGTMDATLARMIVADDSEYRLPIDADPQVILDIGANIGATAVYFAEAYPTARIECFEPLPENLALLRHNVERYGPRVRVHPFGLADRDGEFRYYYSDDTRNFGGGGFVDGPGTDAGRSVVLPLRQSAAALREAGIDRTDVIKIDTEGSEWPILRSLPPALLAEAQVVVGELHGSGDWEVCQLLAPTHTLSVDKRLAARCFHFAGARRDLVGGARRAA